MFTKPSLRRLPLEGTQNTRELGGYPCPGGSTRWGVYLRSDNPGALTPADIAYLQAYGLTDAVDLRHPRECAEQPSALALCGGFAAVNLPLIEHLRDISFEGDVPGSMAGLYIALLDEAAPRLAGVLRVLARAKGGALFHCAVGKDRTGVVAMLLLKLAGVANADVVADYAATDIYMTEVFEAQKRVFTSEIEEYVLKSHPTSMHRTLRHLKETYGTAEDYLLGAGLAAGDIARIREKFVEPAL